MTVLVTGGAGYIGSVTVEALRRAGQSVIVVDNLSRGHRAAVDPEVPFFAGDVGDRGLIRRVVDEQGVKACVHFAALTYVGESVEEPDRHYANNVGATVNLLDALTEAGVRRFVFSSTCATYGEPIRVPIDETHPQRPENPYGWTKFFIERELEVFEANYGLRYVALRYFNAAGAIDLCGEDHSPESHLIPLALQVALGQRDGLTVFGRDYDTPDGSCIRDYVHVQDLARAHLAALGHLAGGGDSQYVNLGTGRGWSVLEVIAAARLVTGCQIPTADGDRRAGDASSLVADASKARAVLGWSAQIPDLAEIVASAWTWHSAHPSGYEGI
ncbi:MAG: UDP-glucose 4-epimerase GalE [Candidatus Latescibacterota bacterium]